MSAAAARRAVLAALAFGAFVRIALYATNLSLWHDEAFIALIVRNVPFSALLGPLDWNEPSPPGFLALEQALVGVCGESERTLRAVPLLASLGGLLVLALLAVRGCVDRNGALCAIVLAAASNALIPDAASVKHFSFDLLLAAALGGLAWRACGADARARVALSLWGIVGAVGLWLSYAVVFSVAGGGAVLAWQALRRRDRAGLRALVVSSVVIAVSAGVLSGAVFAQRSHSVVEFWTAQFPPRDGLWPLTVWLVRALIALFDQLWRPLGGLLIPLALAAAVTWWRSDRRPLLGILCLPVLGSLLASAVGWWPFGGTQHMRFAAPAMLLLSGDGLELLRRALSRRRPLLAPLTMALVLGSGVALAAWRSAVPRQRHAMREAIAFMQARARPDDQLAVFDPASFAYYTGRDLRHVPLAIEPGKRVWVITPASSHGDLHPRVVAFVEQLAAQRRPRLAEQVRDGAAALLFGGSAN
jgi:hypothetical protein